MAGTVCLTDSEWLPLHNYAVPSGYSRVLASPKYCGLCDYAAPSPEDFPGLSSEREKDQAMWCQASTSELDLFNSGTSAATESSASVLAFLRGLQPCYTVPTDTDSFWYREEAASSSETHSL